MLSMRLHPRNHWPAAALSLVTACLFGSSTNAAPFFVSTGNVTDAIATASRPESGGAFEIESADDFFLTAPTQITGATFTGLLPLAPPGATLEQVVVET